MVVVDWGIAHVEEMVMAVPIVADSHNVHKTAGYAQPRHRNGGRNASASYIYYQLYY